MSYNFGCALRNPLVSRFLEWVDRSVCRMLIDCRLLSWRTFYDMFDSNCYHRSTNEVKCPPPLPLSRVSGCTSYALVA